MKTTEQKILTDIMIGLFYLQSVYGTIPICGRQLTYAEGERPYRLAEADGKPIAAFASPEAVAQFLTKQ
jgi:hypothetical protein